jgi:hypothetical protein
MTTHWLLLASFLQNAIDVRLKASYNRLVMNTPILERLTDLRRRLTWLRDGL